MLRRARAADSQFDSMSLPVRKFRMTLRGDDTTILEHDPEKWAPVFPRDKREAFARRSCSNKKIEQDDDSKKSHPALASVNQALHGDRGGFAAADAERCDPAFQIVRFERMQQRHDQARAGGADGMPERAGAAIDVQLLSGNPEIASLISNRSTSPTLQPTLSSSLRIAGIGAVVNHCGSWLWVAWPLISASAGRPSRSTSERLARINAAAPSALAEEAAGVIVPLARNAAFNPGILAGSTFSGCSSFAIIRSPAFSVSVIGTISALNAPRSTALRARVSVSMA